MNHREAVGGLWEELGTLGFRFLVDHGLEPSHRLIDIGCGSGRIGRHLVAYLDPGHYYGLDAQAWLLDAAELDRSRDPHLLCDDQFRFDRFAARWDVAFMQSVLTHLPRPAIATCLARLRPHLDGPLYATHFDPAHPGALPSYPDRDPYHQSVDDLAALAPGWEVEPLGEWGHPRGQHMVRLV